MAWGRWTVAEMVAFKNSFGHTLYGIPLTAQMPPKDREVILFVEDPAVAIHGKPVVGWNSGTDARPTWWAGLPASYISLAERRWTVTHWRPLHVDQPDGGAASGLTQQLQRAVEASDEGHDPFCMAILRGKDCSCGLDERNAGVPGTEGQQQKPTLICPRCKVDRFKEPCPGPHSECPMKANAHGTPGVPERKRPATGAPLPLPPAEPTGSGGWCEMCGVTHEGPHPAGVAGKCQQTDCDQVLMKAKS